MSFPDLRVTIFLSVYLL